MSEPLIILPNSHDTELSPSLTLSRAQMEEMLSSTMSIRMASFNGEGADFSGVLINENARTIATVAHGIAVDAGGSFPDKSIGELRNRICDIHGNTHLAIKTHVFGHMDFALIELRNAVSELSPRKIRRADTLEPDEPLYIVNSEGRIHDNSCTRIVAGHFLSRFEEDLGLGIRSRFHSPLSESLYIMVVDGSDNGFGASILSGDSGGGVFDSHLNVVGLTAYSPSKAFFLPHTIYFIGFDGNLQKELKQQMPLVERMNR